jgi:hypothetical protein
LLFPTKLRLSVFWIVCFRNFRTLDVGQLCFVATTTIYKVAANGNVFVFVGMTLRKSPVLF